MGAGASGVLVAAHLAPETRAAIIDAGARAARGLAYGTPYGAHLLNVPAGRMSAFADRAEHFLEWLRTRDAEAVAGTFAPRTIYGEYLGEVLASSAVERVIGSAVGLTRSGSEWTVHLNDDRKVVARNVVIALGNLPPADPIGSSSNRYLRDPWAPGAAQGLGNDAPILIIGTGLTMIDLVLALRHEGHRGRIYAISRRGLLPRAHRACEPVELDPPAGSPREMLTWMRAQKADWRAVIDSLRPHTARLWQRWTFAQRASFLRHLRTFWDVHRHRAAPQVAAEIEELMQSGTLTTHRGRIESIDDGTVRWNGNEVVVDRIINCTGPASNYGTVDLPLVAQMRRTGWLVPDPLHLGVENDADGRLIDSTGNPIQGLFTLGPLRRSTLWESTAIPEIRAQAAALAAKL